MIGSRLGPYEITAKLGAGGMGEVWRAHDTKLKRDVAIKVLPAEFVEDRERLARFEREAQLLAQLNHPNIAQIYGLEASGDTHALVLELVEGPTLADRLESGALPLEEALSIARQVAEALEEAHEKGIIHRDLKPQNIKASIEGRVKVLDFGLAKAFEATSAVELSPSHLAQSPTLTLGGTREGVILGTAAYMSPEQAKGLVVDKRADIWAFGVVLFEMLTGRSLFAGDSVPDTLAHVLQREIDFEVLRRATPPAIRRLLRRCLERQPKNRLHDIADARIVIVEALTTGDGAGIGAEKMERARAANRLPWLLGGLVVGGLIAIAVGAVFRAGSSSPTSPFRGQFDIDLPAGRHLDAYYRRAVAISPDGRTLAVITSGAVIPPAGPFDPDRRIEVRAIDGDLFRPIAGTEGAFELAFSPDGKWLAFTVFKPGVRPLETLRQPWAEIRKVRIEGGQPVKLADTRGGWGLSWGDNGMIAFAEFASPVQQVPAEGGTPEAISRTDTSELGGVQRHPLLLPGGQVVLYDEGTSDRAGSASYRLYAQRLGSSERTLLATGAVDPRFAPPDHLFFARDGSLFTMNFDPVALKVRGDPAPLIPSLAHSTGRPQSLDESGQGQYDVSRAGVLVFAPGAMAPAIENEVVRVDPRGNETVLDLPPAPYFNVRLSPDGKRLLLSRIYPDLQVQVLDLESGGLRQVTYKVNAQWGAIWGPMPGEITFTSDHEGGPALYAQSIAGGSETLRRLTQPSVGYRQAAAWSADGRTLVFISIPAFTQSIQLQIWFLSGDRATPYLASDFYQGEAEISPDGRWLLDVDTESGERRVWVRPFRRNGNKIEVSANGATSPVWSRDGRWIYFSAPEASGTPGVARSTFFRERFEADGDEIRLGKPERLFAGVFFRCIPIRCWDVGPNGDFYLSREHQLDPKEELRRAGLLFPKKLIVRVGMLHQVTGGSKR